MRPQVSAVVDCAFSYAHIVNQVLDNAQELQRLCTTILEILPRLHKEYSLDSLYKLLSSLLNKKAEGMPPTR